MGFQIEYSTYSFTCGGNFNNHSGVLSSPLYPNPYPTADCVYLISQPNGTYINISFITIYIYCQGLSTLTSDYIEMRDGRSQDSPLMGMFCGNESNVPDFMHTTQNHLRIRWEKEGLQLKYNTTTVIVPLRFFSNYFASGMGFQLEYESTNVSQWSYSSGACGGSFTTPQGIFTSPSYPGNYPDNADCNYTISQPSGNVILLNFLTMDLADYGSTCNSYDDYIDIRDGPSIGSPGLGKLCGNKIPAPIQSSQNQLWMKW